MRRYKKTNYMISEHGHIYSKGVRMKPALDKKGYLRTMLVLDGKAKTIKVHRIVAETFIPNPENKPQVNHKNSIKSDNRVENLEWVTAKENVAHAIENGNFHHVAGWNKGIELKNSESIGTSKLTEKEVVEIREKFEPRKYTRKMLADEYGVSPECIKDVVLKKTWSYL